MPVTAGIFIHVQHSQDFFTRTVHFGGPSSDWWVPLATAIELAKERRPFLKQQKATMLSDAEQVRVADRLRALAGNDSPDARATALRSLGRTRDMENVPLLIAARLVQALGAALMAGLGAGVFSSTQDLQRMWQLDRAFEPHMSVDERHAHLARWHTAVARARH